MAKPSVDPILFGGLGDGRRPCLWMLGFLFTRVLTVCRLGRSLLGLRLGIGIGDGASAVLPWLCCGEENDPFSTRERQSGLSIVKSVTRREEAGKPADRTGSCANVGARHLKIEYVGCRRRL